MIILVVLIFSAILQASFVPQIRFAGGGPDLVFLVVLAWAARRDLSDGLTWAIVGGLLQDLLSAAPLGTSSLAMLLPVFLIYLLNQQLYKVGLLTLLVLTFVSTFFKELVMALVMTMTGFGANYFQLFQYVVIPTAIYNVVAMVAVYWFIKQIHRRTQQTSPVLQ